MMFHASLRLLAQQPTQIADGGTTNHIVTQKTQILQASQNTSKLAAQMIWEGTKGL